MSRSAIVATAAIVLVLAALGAGLSTPPAAEGSSLSSRPQGWAAARAYLEARGAEVSIRERSGPAADADVLVTVFPWRGLAQRERVDAVMRHLDRGGVVVAAFTGARLSIGEEMLADRVGLAMAELRPAPSVVPWRWWSHMSEEWTLVPEGGDGAAVVIRAPRRFPRAAPEARVLWRGPGGEALVFAAKRRNGILVALPAEALSNARIAAAGNADLLEWLRGRFGDRWAFDEVGHPLAPAAASADPRPARAMDAFLLQLALLYALAVFAVSRRFGPAWAEPPVVAGSTGAFLLGLGAVHDRCGHHAEASRLLVSRAAELDPRLEEWAGRRSRRAVKAGAAGLVETAREVAAAQARRGGLR